MPPLLALFLCIVFVVYLLRADRMKAENLSHAVWLPTIWLMYGASRQLVYWFGGAIFSDNASTSEEGSQIDRLFLSSLILLAFIVLARRGIRWKIVFDRNHWLVVLYSYAFISILWSDVPFASFKRFVRLAGGVLMALVILTERSPTAGIRGGFQTTGLHSHPFLVRFDQVFS